MQFWVYILRCSDGSYYTGHTDALEARLAQHREGLGSDWTRTRRPVDLIWCADVPTREEALAFERRVKNWSRAKKEAMMAGDWPRVGHFARPPCERPSTSLGTNEVGDVRRETIAVDAAGSKVPQCEPPTSFVPSVVEARCFTFENEGSAERGLRAEARGSGTNESSPSHALEEAGTSLFRRRSKRPSTSLGTNEPRDVQREANAADTQSAELPQQEPPTSFVPSEGSPERRRRVGGHCTIPKNEGSAERGLRAEALGSGTNGSSRSHGLEETGTSLLERPCGRPSTSLGTSDLGNALREDDAVDADRTEFPKHKSPTSFVPSEVEGRCTIPKDERSPERSHRVQAGCTTVKRQ